MPEPERVVGKRILIVDDEPGTRDALKLLLALDAHQVKEAANGKEACYLFVPGDFDLVITDYSMPEMRGDELARTLKCLVPSLPILMITAYAAQVWSRDNPVDAILPKPFTLGELRRTIGDLLAPEGSRIRGAMPALQSDPQVRAPDAGRLELGSG